MARWPLIPPPLISIDLVRCAVVRMPVWYFARQRLDDYTVMTWRFGEWWSGLPVLMRSHCLRGLMALGLWDVIVEAGYYWEDGRFRIDFWNTKHDRKARYEEEQRRGSLIRRRTERLRRNLRREYRREGFRLGVRWMTRRIERDLIQTD